MSARNFAKAEPGRPRQLAPACGCLRLEDRTGPAFLSRVEMGGGARRTARFAARAMTCPIYARAIRVPTARRALALS